jgi:hypothetical protein
MMKSALAALLLILAGCASVRDFVHDHPAVTAIGAAVVVGSIVASVSHDGHPGPATGAIGDPNAPPCTVQPDHSCR